MDRNIDVSELIMLMRDDPDIRLMIAVVCDHHQCDLVGLSEQYPAEFDALYDAAYSIVSQIPLEEIQ